MRHRLYHQYRTLAASVLATAIAGLLAVAACAWVAPSAIAGTQWPPSCSSSGFSCDNTGYQGQSTWGFPGGHNCTNYVAWRLQHNGMPEPTPDTFVDPKSKNHEGDAGEWFQAAKNHGILTDGTPTVGSVAWWAPNQGADWHAGLVGHVAYVQQVKSPTDIVVAEDNAPPTSVLDIREVWAGDADWPGAFIHYGEKAGPSPSGDGPSGNAAVVHDGYTSLFTVNAADSTLQETYLAKNGQPWHTQNLSANTGTPPVASGTSPAAVYHSGYTSVYTVNAADGTLQETYLPALGQPWHTQNLSASTGTPPVAAGTSPAGLYHTGYISVFTVNAADGTLQETYLPALGQPWHTQNLSASTGTPPVAAGTSPAPVLHASASGAVNFTSVFTVNAADGTLQETYLSAIGQPWVTQSLSADSGTPPIAANTSPLALYHTGYTSVYTINAADHTLQETFLAVNGQPWVTQSLSASFGTPPVASGVSPVALVHPDSSGAMDFTSVYTINAADDTVQESYLAAIGQPWHTQTMLTPPASAS